MIFDKKTLLYFALMFVGFLLWSAWQSDYLKPTVTTSQPTTVAGLPETTPLKQLKELQPAAQGQQVVEVKTDVLNLKINTKGGHIVSLDLPKYPKTYETPDVPVQLLTNSEDNYYVAESGLISTQGANPQNEMIFSSPQSSYTLQPGQDTLAVTLNWKSPNGVQVNKTYQFHRGKYDTDLTYQITNNSAQPWSGDMYVQIKRRGLSDEGGFFGLHTYRGAAISSTEDPYQKISYQNMDKKNLDSLIKGGWVAMLQRYFVSAWVPKELETQHYYSRVTQVGPSNKPHDKIYTIGFASPTITVAPHSNAKIAATFYAGPEITQNLKEVAPHLDLVIDYGWLWIFSAPIFKVMQVIYDFVGNWGVSIILVTVLIKLLFYKLSETSYRSMAKMRNLQPRILALKERYGDDRQKLSQATMELYRQEKVNPLGGCLPVLVQIPVFIALYYVLISSVELRQAPFVFWIHDLSVKDPYYLLPILMGLSWVAQQKLNPPPPDPMQAKMMMMFPVVFTVLFATFPAGLVLYWLVNNCLSILQQWYIMRKYETQGNKKKIAQIANKVVK
jgi:YidC/Oxa1 family membrane protein insertase